MKRFFLILIFSVLFITTGISQDLPSNIPANGLVAYYPFNGNANDVSGNGNNGTVSGATLTSDKDGNTNKAYEFTVDENGGWGISQDEITITSDPLMDSNEITLSAWVYPRSKPGNFANRPLTVFGRWEINVANEVFRFKVTEDNKIYFQAGSESFGSGQINYDTWSHIAITFGSNGTVKSYLNGNYVDETNFSTPLNVNSQSNLTIGSLPSSNGTWYFFDGKLDELGYWNRVLTSQEILNLFSGSADILLNGSVSAENNQIKNVANPTDAQDAATKSYVDSNINSFSGSYNDLTEKPTVFNGSLIGDLTGNVTGDVTGNLAGNVSGDLTGNVTGDVTGNLTGNVTGNVTSDILKLNTLTQTEIDAITPEEGMVLYNQSKKKIQIYSTSSTSLSNGEFTGQYAPDDSYDRVSGWQTFIAPFTGTIYGISLYLKKKNGDCCMMSLNFNGDFVNVDRSDDTYQNASVNSSFWHEFTLNNPVSVNFGESYSFYVNSEIFDLGVNFDYSDGEFNIDTPNNFAGGVDLMFLVSYTVDPDSPVTLSWINLN